MTRNESYPTTTLNEAIDKAVATYGALPVFFRAFRAMFRSNRPPPPMNVDELPDYLRRDVGLPKIYQPEVSFRSLF